MEYIWPRIMVQLRERTAQLVKHLNNEDVNGSDGTQKIFDTFERSPLVKQLDKHRVDQHRKRLMSFETAVEGQGAGARPSRDET